MDDTYFALKYGLPVCFNGIDDLVRWWQHSGVDYAHFDKLGYGQRGSYARYFFPFTSIGDGNNLIDSNTVEYIEMLRKDLEEYDILNQRIANI